MTLRKQQTIRFVVVVVAILCTAMLSIYFFTNYFLNKNFYRRLNNRAETIVGWLSQTIDNQEDIKILERFLKSRKDQMPAEEVLIYNLQNKLIFGFNNTTYKGVPENILNKIRLNGKTEFEVGEYEAVGILYKTNTQRYMVIAIARNEYGQGFLIQMRWMMFGLTVASLFLITFIGWYFAKKTLEPILKIGEELNQIFPKKLNLRLKVDKNDDEIGTLSEIINQLLERIEEGIQSQQMFIANVSHELQNPLTRISSQLEVSLMNERTPENYRKTLYSVLEDITELVTLTQNLLKLSRSNIDGNILLAEKVRLDEVFWEVQNILIKNNPTYKVEINFIDLPEDPEQLCILGNHALLRTVLLNLAENACKFSEDNQAHLSLSVNSKQKILYVKDNGKGIEKAEIEQIFQPFYRSEKTTNIKGYGIGLSLVDRIIKIHGGRIEVNSVINKGTIFKITFDS